MKAATFENLIRKVVREEIDYALRREIKSLKEDLHSELKPTIVEHTERLDKVPEVPKTMKSPLRDEIMGSKPVPNPTLNQPPPPPQSYTNNSTLNDLLNETARGDTALEGMNQATHMTQPLSMEAPQPQSLGEGAPTKALNNIFNRDYTDLIKVFNKKSKGLGRKL
tara:strand:+ start:1431 stop:1928 length:498 start_codon:yes stop_codon:yes gene_type:complete